LLSKQIVFKCWNKICQNDLPNHNIQPNSHV
jgi:hypothetical protein